MREGKKGRDLTSKLIIIYLALSLLYWEDHKTTDEECKSKRSEDTHCQSIECSKNSLVLLMWIEWKMMMHAYRCSH